MTMHHRPRSELRERLELEALAALIDQRLTLNGGAPRVAEALILDMERAGIAWLETTDRSLKLTAHGITAVAYASPNAALRNWQSQATSRARTLAR